MKRTLDTATALSTTDAMVLCNLDQAALTLNADAIAGLLTDPVAMVRRAAVTAIRYIDEAALTLHAGAIMGVLEDSNPNVRYAAISTIRRLDEAFLARHSGAIVGLLADAYMKVRDVAMVTISDLGRAALKPTTSALVGLLSHTASVVRCNAMRALGNLGEAALKSYVGAIAGFITDPISDARCKAVEFLALACGAGANMLTDPDFHVRYGARETLDKLKRTRARLHWATTRAYVQIDLVRPYALCWHEYVGERLCAPGGKWAQSDRAAFEEEFN